MSAGRRGRKDIHVYALSEERKSHHASLRLSGPRAPEESLLNGGSGRLEIAGLWPASTKTAIA